MKSRMAFRGGVGVAFALASLVLAMSPNAAQAHNCPKGTVWTKICLKSIPRCHGLGGHCGKWEWKCAPPPGPCR